MEAPDPGMPTSTAAINDPDTPPTYIPTSMEKLSSVLMAKVIGRINVIPNPPDNPGIAPRIAPTTVQIYIMMKFIGCIRVPNAVK